MAFGSRDFSTFGFLLLLFSLKVLVLTSAVRSEQSEINSSMLPGTPTSQKGAKEYVLLEDCKQCSDRKELDHSANNSVGQFNSHQPNKNIDIIATYTDASGVVKLHMVKSKDLSPSWVIEKYDDENHIETKGGLGGEGSNQQPVSGLQDHHQPPTDQQHHSRQVDPVKLERRGGEGSNQQPVSRLQDHHQPPTDQQHHSRQVDPVKLERRQLREERKQKRSAELIHMNENVDLKMQIAAIERSEKFDTTIRGKYSIWRREYQNPQRDTILKHMKDQIILAKVYSSIARPNKMRSLSDALNKLIKESLAAIGEANSDAELQNGALEQAKAMGHALSTAKDKLSNCDVVARKLRAMVQSTEETVMALKKKSMFLTQFASWSIPKSLHCLHLQLTNDYFLHNHSSTELPDKNKIDDPSLYHYAIFSDNVLSTAVVVKSLIINAKEPEKHVLHIVTDRLNFRAMKMWFIAHPPLLATVDVENIDEFKWLNSSYCPVLRQLESSKMKEFYFKVNHPSTLAMWDEHLKYRNPKYLSMLNHLRFYMPELFPKLDKILFLDDDIVVQKDLTPLWSIDMKGMVNGAVETCKKGFHHFDSYLNFSNPKISQNFDPCGCGWAFGMNIFDLKEWKKRNLTGVYHYWQDLNEERQLWKLGSLPPGLITFYKLTFVLDQSWHVLALGYNPSINQTEIEEAAVIHFNGNNKPWLDLAFSKYKGYWAKYVTFDNPYLRLCNINE